MLVAKFYQAYKMDDKFDKSHKKEIRGRCVITQRHFDKTNDNWDSSGKFYEKDQEATNKYYEDSAKQVAGRKKAAELRDKGAKGLADAILNVSSLNSNKTLGEETPTEQWEDEKLVSWLNIKEIPSKVEEGSKALYSKAKQFLTKSN